jgi:Golgi apparatus protein 1
MTRQEGKPEMKTSVVKSTYFAATMLCMGVMTMPGAGQAQSIFASCEKDLARFCSAVTPGHGRITACLYSHEDQVSPSCDAAIAESADLIDMLFDRLRTAKQECGQDVAKLCGEVEVGQGRVFSCLHEKKTELSSGCLAIIDNVQLPSN